MTSCSPDLALGGRMGKLKRSGSRLGKLHGHCILHPLSVAGTLTQWCYLQREPVLFANKDKGLAADNTLQPKRHIRACPGHEKDLTTESRPLEYKCH